jgi:hypothetical protein
MESSASSTSSLSIAQRIALKRAQVLTEMNETIHTLSCIEAVLDEINRSVRPVDVDNICRNGSKPSFDDTLSKKNETAISASQKMEQLMMELEKWEDL